ncbi:MAG: ATP-binding protein [Pseudomonadota bacterium]
MTLSPALVLFVGAGYVALLFLIAFAVDGRTPRDRPAPWQGVLYTLSLAIYCTSWTFYGAVGTAVRSGLEFVTIYIGPTLILMAWWVLMRKMARVAKAQRVTSIADFISARYGKSRLIAVLVTLVAIAAITPYIALQLLAVSKSFRALTGEAGTDTAFWTAAAMAFFVILFGTRRLSADESQPGIVAAIAFESLVKLAALLAVALLAVASLSKGPVPGATAAGWPEALAAVGAIGEGEGTRWVVLTLLSALAMLCLPRQFQVGIIENRDERDMALASWLFPTYLFLIAVAVLPIAAAGLTRLPAGAEPDLFVLSVPLLEGSGAVALFAFIGGLSAATSMVIVASLALAVMISNHLVAPLLLGGRRTGRAGLSGAVLATRRVAIAGVMALGYLYGLYSDGTAGLASLGLIAFAGVAQFAPALVGGLFWRDATREGAALGLCAGAALWLVTLLLPSFGVGVSLLEGLRALLLPASVAQSVDPLVFGTVTSLTLNTVVYVALSLLGRSRPLDALQATLFVDALSRGGPAPTLRRSADRRDLMRLTRRVLGPVEAHRLFDGEGDPGAPVDGAFLAKVEREIALTVGAGSAHALVTRVATGEPLTVETAIAVLGETQEAIRLARDLGVRSVALERTAEELREANDALTTLLAEKDVFLSRVSHEMRTPLTAVRAFAELLREGGMDEARQERSLEIIVRETARLTRLLDDILDLSRLEAGRAPLNLARLNAGDVARRAAGAMEGVAEHAGVAIAVDVAPELPVVADADRLMQALVNLISNAVKFHGDAPDVTVSGALEDAMVVLRVTDGGHGIDPAILPHLFTKFAGAVEPHNPGGAGLGLAIAREIVTVLGGSLNLERTGPEGTVFALKLPPAPVTVQA